MPENEYTMHKQWKLPSTDATISPALELKSTSIEEQADKNSSCAIWFVLIFSLLKLIHGELIQPKEQKKD